MDIERAAKKLRQAVYFLDSLEYASQDIAIQLRKTSTQLNYEPLEYFFSACLSAAQSVYYVLDETGGEGFRRTQRVWRESLKNDLDGTRFGKMIGLRDKDVHLARTDAIPKPKYIEENRYFSAQYNHSHVFHNAAIFGEQPILEEKNPDGTVVRGSNLSGTVGLYLDWGGQQVEATTVCREFIKHLRSLLDAVTGRANGVS